MKPRLLSGAALALAVVIALVVMRPASGGLPYLLSLICIWAIFAIGFDIAFGLAGLLSFGHASFFATGAYAMALLMARASLPFSAALGGAAVAGGLAAALFGVVALRLSGLYFALTTLALSQLFQIVLVVKLRWLTGGTDGLSGIGRPSLAGIDFGTNGVFCVLLVAILAATIAVTALLRASPFGHALRAVRQNETRAEQLGLNAWRMKLAALSLSGAYAGFAGGLLASLMSFVGPESAAWTTSGDVLIMTVLGGTGTLLGPVLGVAAFELLKEVLSSYTVHWYGLLGVIFICCTLYFPSGLYGLGRAMWRRGLA